MYLTFLLQQLKQDVTFNTCDICIINYLLVLNINTV